MKAGIYFHIPFCKQACHYCNFHFSTTLKNKSSLLNAIGREIDLRKKDWQKHDYQSIYFGGGTPSLLNYSELNELLNKVKSNFSINENAEITLEANPDDLSKDYLKQLLDAGINRLSIGVQSFFDKDLEFMNRAHNEKEAVRSIEDAYNIGIKQISIDLIYGTPGMNNAQWLDNLKIAASLPISHISCYALTLEPNTAFHHFVKKEKMQAPDDGLAEQQFKMLQDFVNEKKWEHYEISNIAIDKKRAIHNSSYWNGNPYIGFGPSAHSFDGHKTRAWNISSNAKYIRDLEAGVSFSEEEVLTKQDRFNEILMTGLRRKEGLSFSKITDYLDDEVQANEFKKNLNSLKKKKHLLTEGDNWKINKESVFLADYIISELFWI